VVACCIVASSKMPDSPRTTTSISVRLSNGLVVEHGEDSGGRTGTRSQEKEDLLCMPRHQGALSVPIPINLVKIFLHCSQPMTVP
jgi:hypothetical protein